MRNPNGFGGVSKIGGNKKRRNPWRARVTDRWEFDETKGRAIQKFRTIGYFPTRKDAILALSDYNKNPAKKGTAEVTFSDLFDMWKAKRGFEKAKTPSEKKTWAAYRGSYKHSEPLHDMKVKDIKVEHLEKIMEELAGGVALQRSLKTFWNQIFTFAIDKEIITRNIAKSIKTRDKDSNKSNRIPFTIQQINMLWDNVGKIDGVDTVLIMIYTGMRPSELLEIETENIHLNERYMIGGIKTEAGKNRVIPLHQKIVPLIEKRMGSTHLIMMADGKKPMGYRYYLEYIWGAIKETLELENLTPHCCRHTFATIAVMAEIDARLQKIIMGHSTGDITERYTHAYIETLVAQIDKINI